MRNLNRNYVYIYISALSAMCVRMCACLYNSCLILNYAQFYKRMYVVGFIVVTTIWRHTKIDIFVI